MNSLRMEHDICRNNARIRPRGETCRPAIAMICMFYKNNRLSYPPGPDSASRQRVKTMKILSLEDDPAHAELIQLILHNDGHDVKSFKEGSQAIRFLETSIVDLLLLDLSIPGISGMEVLGWARERLGKDVPILIVTGHSREDDIVAALDAGADDYMVKPLRARELTSRVNALLRRAYPSERRTTVYLEIGPYVIDMVSRTVALNHQPINLTPKEFEIACLLFRNVGRVVPRQTLIKLIWGRDLDKVSRSLDTHVYRLRSKLHLNHENNMQLRSIYTHGYKLDLIEDTLNPDRSAG